MMHHVVISDWLLRWYPQVTSMLLKRYIVAPAILYGILPYLRLFVLMSPLRKKLYGEGQRRRIYFPRDALRKLGVTPSRLCAFFQLPLLSPVEVPELNQAAQEYQRKYGAASLKKIGREQGRLFVRKGFLRSISPENPFTAHRFLMNCFSLFIGAKGTMGRVEMGRYAHYDYLEREFPFELGDGKIVPGEKYLWTFIQGVASTELCHNKQMRAEVTRKDDKVHVVSKSVEEWGDYLLDHIDQMF
ncbi:MAG: hypothetical protein ACUVWO_10120 [Thermodesulfobacteriota bacterium]